MTSTQPNGGSAAVAAPPMQVLMLGIGSETFAIDAALVREIIDPIPMTRVAGARSFLPGVVNVRGNVVPLADIRERFGMPARQDTGDTRFVVIEIELDDDPVVLALVADKVFEVTEISREQAQQTPRIGISWEPDFIDFITKWNNEFIIVPCLTKILN